MFFFLEKYASFKLWHKLKYNITKYCYFFSSFFFQQNHINKTTINEKKNQEPWHVLGSWRSGRTPPFWSRSVAQGTLHAPCDPAVEQAEPPPVVTACHGTTGIPATFVLRASHLSLSLQNKNTYDICRLVRYMGFLLALTRGLTLQLNL